ncbi:hypothetical protein [Actinomycetospora soli]|uniref:hypothetical protein n=1 Tax=Actinomycetospora soli TaxID=2893887 RepID=UPI001E2D2421|nr:hypothetical protein [Actinomycetospora soli]MCD2187792.1 hypothetical protein [Actinomycetospora soli]
MTDDLPPRPDPWTGLPLPPPAPGPRAAPPARRMPRRPKPPPAGRGPVLVGRSGSARVGTGLFVGGLVVVGAVLGAAGLFERPASVPVSAWVALGLVVVLLAVWGRGTSRDYLAVGADWLSDGTRWVDLYDLVEVRGSIVAAGQASLRFVDGSGRRVERQARQLREDPLMWDLVHLGVRWSRAVHDVRINPLAAQFVGDDPVAGGAYLVARPRLDVERQPRADADTDDLPPRPDPATGRPLPPPAPWTSPDATPRVPRRPQTPPPGRGPLLSGTSGFSPVGLLVVGLVVAAVAGLVGVTVGVGWLLDSATSTVFLGACLVAIVGGIGWLATVTYVGAGADWAADERSWVDLYDLVAVRRAPGRWWTPGLALVDGDGRRVVLPLRELRRDVVVGRYVHLGVRWSEATHHVDVDPGARSLIDDRE